jgi:hypothetical protein
MSEADIHERELQQREERARAYGVPLVLTREVAKLPDGEGWLRMDVVPALGVHPDEHWLENIPARSRLRLTRRWETRFAYPLPDRWPEFSGEWLVRLWDGAEPA